MGLIWSSLMSVIFFFLLFTCVNSQNLIAKTRQLSKTIKLISIFRMLRCFIWKQSKIKAFQRFLQYPSSTEKVLHRILVRGPLIFFNVVLEGQWSRSYSFSQRCVYGVLFLFPWKSNVMKVCAIPKEVLAIKSARNYLTVFLGFFVFFS